MTRVSINSTSEEVRSDAAESKKLEELKFPLIQLPRKSEAVEISHKNLRNLDNVSINSTSEEVRRIGIISSGLWFINEFPLIQLPRKSEAILSFPQKKEISCFH